MRFWLNGLGASLMILSGCVTDDSNKLLEEGNVYAPHGAVARKASVSGLVVGHRLMETGEYELALKAYLRAAAEKGQAVDVLSALGSANLRLGRLQQSEALLRRAIAQDEYFVPAWNNLGVVLMQTNRVPEASLVFQTAFALDSGKSDDIRKNLSLALSKMENPDYNVSTDNNNFGLVRRENGRYLLLKAP